MSSTAYDYCKVDNDDIIDTGLINLKSYSNNRDLLFGTNTDKLSDYKRGLLTGYTLAMDLKDDTYLGEEMFRMADTSINTTILERIDKTEDKLNSSINEKFKYLNQKNSEIENGVNNIDKRLIAIETLMNTTNKTIESNHENVINKLNEISSTVGKMNEKLITIETENKVKETTKDRIIRQCLFPIIGGAIVFILGKLLGHFFP